MSALNIARIEQAIGNAGFSHESLLDMEDLLAEYRDGLEAIETLRRNVPDESKMRRALRRAVGRIPVALGDTTELIAAIDEGADDGAAAPVHLTLDELHALENMISAHLKFGALRDALEAKLEAARESLG